MPSGKRRMHSVSDRRYEDRLWLPQTLTGRHPKWFFFIIFDLYRVITQFAEVHTDIARCQVDPLNIQELPISIGYCTF